MVRNRLLLLLGGCLLAASAAWANDVGYVDCTSHPDETQVFAKARKSQDVVATIPCGERFRIVLYGFIFSEVQTGDGKIGYIFSSVISIDRAGVVAQRQAAPVVAAQPKPAPESTQQDTAPGPVTPTTPAPQPTTTPPSTTSSLLPTPPTVAPSSSTAPTQAQTTVQPAPAPAATTSAPSNTGSTNEVVVKSNPATTQPQPAPVTETASRSTETASSTVQPTPASTSQPEAPTEVQPAVVREPIERTSWEKPNPGVRKAFLIELFGGYQFVRMGGSGASNNFNGGMGSFGWNYKPWLQIVGDTSYNLVTVGSTKNVLYGNHYGPRFFFHRLDRWGVTPFAEAFIGGSRADTTVSGSGGYKTSQNCISYKAGGGLDVHAFKRFELRLIDAGYYRTSFGTNLQQNNYYASAGIVLKLFGSGAE
jgi:hypothetical protein